MKVNFIGVAVAALLMLISVFWLRNLTLSMFVIVLNQMFRCVYSEVILSTKIQINVLKDIFLEIVMTAVFIKAKIIIKNIVIKKPVPADIYIKALSIY